MFSTPWLMVFLPTELCQLNLVSNGIWEILHMVYVTRVLSSEYYLDGYFCDRLKAL